MGVVRSGVHFPLEKAADDLIYGSLQGVTKQSEKKDILTPWKEQDRRSKEVYSTSGSVDAAIRKGMYHRVANTSKPYLNSREGVAPAYRLMTGTAAPSAMMGGDDDPSFSGDGE